MVDPEQSVEPDVKALNDRQRAVINSLCTGFTIKDAAKSCGVARRTTSGWLQDDAFQEALALRRQEIADRVGDDVAEVGRLALGVVKGYLASPDDNMHRISPYKINLAKEILLKMNLFAVIGPAKRTSSTD